MKAKIVAAVSREPRLAPPGFYCGNSDDVFDRHAKLVGDFLRVRKMRVDETLLFRLGVVTSIRCRLEVSTLVPSTLALHWPPAGLPAGTRGSSSQSGLSLTSRPSAFAIARAWPALGRGGNCIRTNEMQAKARSPLFRASAT